MKEKEFEPDDPEVLLAAFKVRIMHFGLIEFSNWILRKKDFWKLI